MYGDSYAQYYRYISNIHSQIRHGGVIERTYGVNFKLRSFLDSLTDGPKQLVIDDHADDIKKDDNVPVTTQGNNSNGDQVIVMIPNSAQVRRKK